MSQPSDPSAEQTSTPVAASPETTTPPAPTYAAPVQTPVNSARTNTMAIVSLVTSFFIALAGVIFGHIALSQIKKSGESGRGLAIAGLIIGYIGIAAWIIVLIVYALFLGLLAAGAGMSNF